MLAVLPLLMLSVSDFQPLSNCALSRPVTFFEDLSALPPEIRSDFTARKQIYPRTEKGITFSDTPGPNEKIGSVLLFVAHAENQWLIGYVYGGIAIRTVTVAYLRNEDGKSRPYLMGALQGNTCTSVNAFLQGAEVEPGWER